MFRLAALILLVVLSACAAPRPPVPVEAVEQPVDPSIKSLVQEQEEETR